MGFTRRDAVSAVLGIAVLLVLFAVALGWTWPLVSGYRAAAIAVWVLGVAMCPLTWTALQAAFGDTGARAALQARLGLDRIYHGFMSVTGLLATVLLVWTVATPGQAVFMTLAGVVIGQWVIATARRLIAPVPPTAAPA